ncbi:MAG TPA: hypothetical protein PKK74_04335 [Candidatus Methanoculleus thermohydrogenotrophicum]|jgi:5-hydroxyisourate hydrolase-like protein (transthyretin family)|nr:hypothetical protein [Candidatus Methanoculleus thermohydrogenotrophicum]HOB17906.1 hypothetical protein [Candidatus Methanoculleus thermohydrogenotrophicum]HPZ38041.1 hypothetical protein [Candidatus Methanoculleus thermohydrogenotrophicum]HQC91293.1 hypothetical protein [Candidatus Methanoculleus thermohydrogenotrophicum]
MKRIAWLTLLAATLLVSVASAAYVEINAPETVYVGEPLVVTGTTVTGGLTKPTLNPGFSTDVVLYRIKHSKSEVDRKTIVVQEDGSFSATFDTRGLAAGTYTVEIIDPDYPNTFGGSSKTLQFLKLVDRSGDIKITSDLNQEFDGSLDIAGAIDGIGNAGVRILVEHNGTTVYGPEYIRTDANGAFSVTVPIPGAGTYHVTFSDTRGYIGTTEFVVTGAPTPTETQEPVVSASAPATRSAPAYFEVDTRTGKVTLTTSSGVDWVVEYISEDGDLHKVNEKGLLDPEVIEFSAQGGRIYVKIYPVGYSDSKTVRLSGTNVDAIRVSQDAPGFFGDEVPTPTTEAATPLPAVLALLALLVVVFGRRG